MLPVDKIVIFGTIRAADEVARLGVARSLQVIGVRRGGRPERGGEPWVEGVEWIDAGPGDVEAFGEAIAGATAVVFMADEGLPQTMQAAREAGAKLVYAGRGDVGPEAVSGDVVVARPGPIDDAEVSPAELEHVAEQTDVMRVERLAMALLRAALEDDVVGVLDRAALMELGDAVMLQS